MHPGCTSLRKVSTGQRRTKIALQSTKPRTIRKDVTIMTGSHLGAIAVVDDDPAVRDSLKFLLELAGHTVDTYDSAVAFLADRPLQPACLILDQHMPQVTGLDLAAELKAKGIAIPILLISGALSPGIATRAAELGIEKVLGKAPTEDDLMGFVNAHA
jgi:FixJ family two-component response regulator